ncbi:hydrogenase 2 operon protein HybA [Desulfuromonas carbonis]|uniref:hydrogenase 2 operon protein HybA n=1 Tax=Desulfuromonas sp. DDH964 TaxID=1823759 RepID=UPI00078B531C|nr:hydrogenase 2 operon protein HybA [Desulfuromonas sp. DDH964]AMV73648.1 hydrogenase 2 protein HybA [Desulfuromonas sp. DDH964]
MDLSRRKFLKLGAVAGGSAVCNLARPAAAREMPDIDPDWYGMLNDSTRCIGCKACMVACKKENKLPPESTLGDAATFGAPLYDSPRELSEQTYTLIQLHRDEKTGAATFVKRQCMHCADAACQSACIVGALKKQKNGAVKYDAGMCMGCRYCMVACPFNVPQFEWHAALPSIRKCTLCSETRLEKGEATACASACPAGAITFGKRSELLKIARARIAAEPERYLDQVYGENEVGGTCVLYLTRKDVAFAGLGLQPFGYKPVSDLTESIQHRIFQYFIPPIAVYGVLGGIMFYNQNRKRKAGTEGGDDDY